MAAFVALGAILLLPAGPGAPVKTVSAAFDCNAGEHRLRVEIVDDETGDLITVPGAEVVISPDPDGSGSSKTFIDNGSNDDAASVTGRIQHDEACQTTDASVYTISLENLPGALDDCDIDDDSLTTALTGNVTVEFTLENCPEVTPTVAATGTAGAARTVVVQSANASLGCANTTIITIQVRGANGQAVAAGTLVSIQASLGAVSPTSGQTTADGSVFVFYTAPQNQGGTATVTAIAGSATGSANITVNCNTAPTQAPPPTTAPGGGITPPSTGDGGLSGSTSWHTYAGIAMIVASVIATLVVVRPRA